MASSCSSTRWPSRYRAKLEYGPRPTASVILTITRSHPLQNDRRRRIEIAKPFSSPSFGHPEAVISPAPTNQITRPYKSEYGPLQIRVRVCPNQNTSVYKSEYGCVEITIEVGKGA